jgi:hypothetical protein
VGTQDLTIGISKPMNLATRKGTHDLTTVRFKPLKIVDLWTDSDYWIPGI